MQADGHDGDSPSRRLYRGPPGMCASSSAVIYDIVTIFRVAVT
jgi:hypothetical protein